LPGYEPVARRSGPVTAGGNYLAAGTVTGPHQFPARFTHTGVSETTPDHPSATTPGKTTL